MSKGNLLSVVSAAMRNRMTPLRDEIFLRANGERVAFSEYGDAKGEPVIFCHGWPSSRTMAELTHEAAQELRVRIISPDRPGIADSSFVPNRRLLDWPPLLQELVEFLQIRRFRILAISGGAPYAYATARAMPDSVAAIAVVSGAPDIAGMGDRSGLLALYRWMLSAYRTLPRFSRWSFRLARPFLSLRPPRRSRPILLKMLQPCDAGALRDEKAFEACFESQRRAWRASAEGVLVDAEIYARPWGFSLNEVRVPVRLWHGNADRSFSASVARQMASQIPDCVSYFIDDAGHYSTPIRHMRDIIVDLLMA
jgi:pimeloyl-ACP methyl ester carboxylesterase